MAFLLIISRQAADITVPATGRAFLTVQGEGVQIYRCTQQASGYDWVFQSPEAMLSDPASHEVMGTHGAGPSWVSKDGSVVTGKVLQKMPSPDPASIPWLMLEAQPDPAHPGVFAKTSRIRRSDTRGGNAPATGCDVAHVNAYVRVPYSATYTFYTAN